MSINPYAPPTAVIQESVQPEEAPMLWNPNAAANWSLLFTPAFGAYLLMKNWQALGESKRATSAKRWMIASLILLGLFLIFLPAAAMRAVGFSVLICWYFLSVRPQVAYLKERFGTAYPRKGWAKPLLFGVLGIVALIAVMTIVLMVLQTPTS